jgi:hypothetical protein
LPHARCVPHLIPVNAEQSLSAIHTNRLPDGSQFNPSSSALLETDSPAGWNDDAGNVPGRVEADGGPGQRRFSVTASTPCMLVISEVSYPWWRATVDDRRVELHTVNHAMLGVVIPRGSHSVELKMSPMSVWIGGAISGISILLLGWLLFRA